MCPDQDLAIAEVPEFIRFDRSVVASAENWDVAIAQEKSADQLHRTITIRTPGGELRGSENYKRSSTYLIVTAPEEHLFKTRRDFELFRKYAPPGDDMDCSLIRRARQAVGDKGLVDANTLGRVRHGQWFSETGQPVR